MMEYFTRIVEIINFADQSQQFHSFIFLAPSVHLRSSKEMRSSIEIAHPGCVNASNPFHECGVHCRQKIVQGPARKGKKTSDKPAHLRKRSGGERKGNPNCPNSSNPYHECNLYCHNGFTYGTVNGVSQRKKQTETFQRPDVVNSSFGGSPGNPSPRSPLPAKMVKGSPKSHSFSPSQPQSGDNLKNSGIYIELDMAQLGHQVDSWKTYASGELTNRKNEISEGSFRDVAAVESSLRNDSVARRSISDVSDSYVYVGAYNVRPHLSATLQCILNKYGDIAANSRLESIAVSSFHLECISSIVQDMETTPFELWAKGKVRETMAVLKDAESALIEVAWLRKMINEKCDTETKITSKAVEYLEEELVTREETVANEGEHRWESRYTRHENEIEEC